MSGIDDTELGQLYLSADLFVLPSYHEGYCVPVVEALFAGCPVTYDAGNLPFASGGLGALVPTGTSMPSRAATRQHVERLRAARATAGRGLRMRTAHGDVSEKHWHKTLRSHLAGYSSEAYERRFLALLEAVLRSPSEHGGRS